MTCELQCTCGKVRGTVETAGFYNRCLCYCKSCQAFAHFLGKADEVLDPQAATSVLQVPPSAVSFSAGEEEIACMSLKPGGLLRWHTKCCNTPIGNTPANYKLPFVGLIQNCLRPPAGSSFDESLGPITMKVNTDAAKGPAKPEASSALRIMFRFAPVLLKTRLSGNYKKTPFFSPDGNPLRVPAVLSRDEYSRLMQSL